MLYDLLENIPGCLVFAIYAAAVSQFAIKKEK